MEQKLLAAAMKDMAAIIKSLVKDALSSVSFTDCFEMKLISHSPVRFQKSVDIIAHREMVVLPKGKGFIDEDVGKTYVFIQANQGQKFYYMYERG